MYPLVAAARAQAEVQVTYGRTDEWLRSHGLERAPHEPTGISQYWSE